MVSFTRGIVLFVFFPISIFSKLPFYEADFKLKYLAIGDWGVTAGNGHDSAVGGHFTDRAYNAQINVASHMKSWAQTNAPIDFVLSHGDHFYWSGILKDDYRWNSFYENIYDEPALYVPWYGVMGNHDYGGASGICGPVEWNGGRLCDTPEELVAAINARLQNDYVSPNNNRWHMPDHYYKISIPVTDENGDWSVDIFNIDTNAAGQRISDTCCQCYASNNYWPKGDCNNPGRGLGKCHNGNITMYDVCSDLLEGWWLESMNSLTADLAASTARWKIVHQHYMIKFFTPAQQSQVLNIIQSGGVNIFWGAHEHAEGHDLDYTTGIHFVENGGGGGAENKGGTGNIWNENTFGFMTGKISKNYFQIRFVNDYGDEIHCYNIPNDRADMNLNEADARNPDHPYLCKNTHEPTAAPTAPPTTPTAPTTSPTPAPTTSSPTPATTAPTITPITTAPTSSSTSSPTESSPITSSPTASSSTTSSATTAPTITPITTAPTASSSTSSPTSSSASSPTESSPITSSPTESSPITSSPTTSSTSSPTASSPITSSPTESSPITSSPTTSSTTSSPTASSPTTFSPTTSSTSSPTESSPITSSPTTTSTTSSPTESSPITSSPTTSSTTSSPTESSSITSSPTPSSIASSLTTPSPITSSPITSSPITSSPTTSTTASPTESSSITSSPTPSSITSSPTTPSPTESSPITSSPTESSPITSSPTPSSIASSPTTSSPTESSPIISSPTASSSTSSSPTASSPTTSSPTASEVINCTTDDVRLWNGEQVSSWIDSNGYGNDLNVSDWQLLTGATLIDLTSEKLATMNVPDHLIPKILEDIKNICPDSSETSPTASPITKRIDGSSDASDSTTDSPTFPLVEAGSVSIFYTNVELLQKVSILCIIFVACL